MVRPETPDRFSWTISTVLHLELFVIAGLWVGDGEVLYHFRPDPDFRCAVVPEALPVEIREPPDRRWGRWPMTCDHGGPLYELSMGEDRLGGGLRCGACGWPWWVLRAMSRD